MKSARTLALVPARAGSKGIVGKNTRSLAGKPLVGHAIESALRVGKFDRIIVTTDSEDIAAMGRSFGAEVPFIRPRALADDRTPMLDVLQHAVRFVLDEGWIPETITLLQPTAPFRRDSDLLSGLLMLQDSPAIDSVVSVELVPSHYSPYCVMAVSDGRLVPFLSPQLHVTRRQDARSTYSRNGQFYIMRRETLLEKNSIYGERCVPFITSHRAVNLDTLDDWEAAEELARKVPLPLQ